jgi:hypothetical protein
VTAQRVPAAVAIPVILCLWAVFLVSPFLTVLGLMIGGWMMGRWKVWG